ncbi:MAG TPA: peptidoglycan-associated lipoprotein Pal [Burkholderiales bacterium]|nr:peptidoglycan-associated lipoprotein Pal [Burkholderiales bacterium]
MRATLTTSLIAAICAVVLAACTTTATDGQAPGGVEGRGTPGLGKPGARSDPIERKPIASVDLTQSRKDPLEALKDPGNILSQRSIFYDFDSFDVKEEYRGIVEAHAKYLRENPQARMLIQGNTDERGSREYNVGLGQRRSEGVKKMMVLLGARDDQIESVSLGEEKPLTEGSSEEVWSKNRRSDILYSGEY